MEIIWTKKSLKDLQNIYDFIALESESGAKKVVSSILDTEEVISSHPNVGQVEKTIKLKRTYRYIVEGHCKVIYRVGKSKIYINKVFDTRQHPDKINK